MGQADNSLMQGAKNKVQSLRLEGQTEDGVAAVANDATREVMNYWFAGVDECAPIGRDHPAIRRWGGKDESLVVEVRRLFSIRYHEVLSSIGRGWLPDSDRQGLGVILFLNQLPRHIFRGTAAMYATDDAARALANQMIARIDHDHWPLLHRLFLYYPFMHSERVGDQYRALAYLHALVRDARGRSSPVAPFLDAVYRDAEWNVEIVETFGRFPDRNTILGRTPTHAEVDFMHATETEQAERGEQVGTRCAD